MMFVRRRILGMITGVGYLVIAGPSVRAKNKEPSLPDCSSSAKIKNWSINAGSFHSLISPVKQRVIFEDNVKGDVDFDISITGEKPEILVDKLLKEHSQDSFDSDEQYGVIAKDKNNRSYREWLDAPLTRWKGSIDIELDDELFYKNKQLDLDKKLIKILLRNKNKNVILTNEYFKRIDLSSDIDLASPAGKIALAIFNHSPQSEIIIQSPQFGEIKILGDFRGIPEAIENSKTMMKSLDRDKASGKCEENCFFTTACCRAVGLGDNCFELRTLRWFRDDILHNLPGGEEEIREYYRAAPGIVAKVEALAKPQIWFWFYALYIVPCVLLVKCGFYSTARNRYRQSVQSLIKLIMRG